MRFRWRAGGIGSGAPGADSALAEAVADGGTGAMDEPFIPHQLPHDLPEYEPNDPVPLAWNRVRVFKEGPCWTWRHQCPWHSTTAIGYPHMTHKIALFYALDHVRRCL